MNKWEQLQARIRRLEGELASLKHDVEREKMNEPKEIERRKTVLPRYNPVPETTVVSLETDAPQKETMSKKETVSENVPLVQETKATFNWEKELSQKWLPRVFLFVLILGFMWGFIAAVDEGWLTPPFRLLIGFAVSGLLWFLGEKQLRQNRHNLGISMLAGMVILLTVTTFAMNSLYSYTGFWFTFALYAMWLGIGLWLSARHRSENLAILVAIGGFFIPMLIDGAKNQDELLFYLYEASLYVVYLYFAAKQQFNILHYVSFFVLHLMNMLYITISSTNAVYPVLLLWLQHALLVYLFYYRRYMNNGLHRASTLLTSFGLNYLWTMNLWNDTEAQLTFGLTSALYIGVAVWTWVKGNREKTAIAAIMATVSVGIWTVLALADSDSHLLWSVHLIQGLASMYIGILIKSRVQWLIGFVYTMMGLFPIFPASIEEFWSTESLAWLLALGTIYGFFRLNKTPHQDDTEWYGLAIRSILVIWTWVFGFHVVTKLFENAGSGVSETAILLMTLLYGMVYYFTGIQKTKKWMTVVGHLFALISFFFALQLDLHRYDWEKDAYELSPMNLIFWLAALLSLAFAYLSPMKNLGEKTRRYNIWKHAVTFIMTFLFVSKLTIWVFIEADYVVQNIAMSVAWLTHGLVCILIGRWKQWSSLSVTGMLMLFVVVLKLLFNDLPDISFALRALLFVALGAIGLGVSRFLYRNEKTKKEGEYR